MRYEVTILRQLGELQSAVTEWREFLTTAPRGRSFFNDPSYLEFTLSSGARSPRIVVVRRDGAIRCIAPLSIQPSHFHLRLSVFTLASLPVRMMTLLGGDFIYLEGDDLDHCFSLVFDSLDAGEFDLIFCEALDARSALWKYCESWNGKHPAYRFATPSRTREKAYRLALGDSLEQYLSTLGPNTRKSLRARARKLMSQHSGELIKVSSAEKVRDFANAVDEIFCDSWQAKTYGPIRRNTDAEIARLEWIARAGWLRSYLLLCDHRPIAFQVGYQYGDTFYACDFAYAQAWAQWGPGATLMYLMIEDLFLEKKPSIVDLGYGDSPQKRTFRGSAHDVGDAFILRRNAWRYAVSAQRLLDGIERFTRATLVKARLDAAVRRVLKHKG
jgi:hypothetical protein